MNIMALGRTEAFVQVFTVHFAHASLTDLINVLGFANPRDVWGFLC